MARRSLALLLQRLPQHDLSAERYRHSDWLRCCPDVGAHLRDSMKTPYAGCFELVWTLHTSS